MAKRVNVKFQSEKGAKVAKKVLEKSLSAVGNSKIKINQKEKELDIHISDSSPSKETAAHYGAKRLGAMLEQIDKSIK